MKIIVDNGGTKSDWAIVGEKDVFSFEGINVFDLENIIVNKINNIFSKMHVDVNQVKLYFYTTGANKSIKSKMKKIFSSNFPMIIFSIYSDMLGASRALFKNTSGVACILGTGSNCAYYDGFNNHIITPSLGYLFADEGSGYDLGKRFLFNYLNNKFSDGVDRMIFNKTNLQKDQLLSEIYSSKNPKKYIASFSFLIKEFSDNIEIKAIIIDSLKSFLKKHPFQHTQYHNLKFGFTGSIAFNFKENLSEILQQEKIDHVIIEKPISNLVKYYQI